MGLRLMFPHLFHLWTRERDTIPSGLSYVVETPGVCLTYYPDGPKEDMKIPVCSPWVYWVPPQK